MARGSRTKALPVTRRGRKVAELPMPPFFRQMDFYHPGVHNPRVTIIGAGGIGSPTAMALAKLGVTRIRVQDMDLVAPHNVATTLYSPKDVGKPKVEALKRGVKALTGVEVKTARKRFMRGQRLPVTDVLVMAVDSIAVRKELFEQAKKQKIPFVIDGRIGGQNVRIYAFRPGDKGEAKAYQRTLIPDKKIQPLPCTAQQVVDVGWTTAALITRALRQWESNGKFTFEVILNVNDMSLTQAPVTKTRPDIEDLMRDLGMGVEMGAALADVPLTEKDVAEVIDEARQAVGAQPDA